jgi:multidrug resistance efflux pump
MRYLLLIISPLIVFAKVHYAKVEPYETVTLKSAVSAQVTQAKVELEGTTIKNNIIIKLDDKLNKIKLKSDRDALVLIKNMLKINRQNLKSLSLSLQRQEDYYHRISNISSVSITQKDKAFYSYINAKTQYLSTKEKIESLKKQKLDLIYSIERLKDSISKKTIILKNRFLYKLLVHKGDFVNMSMPLAQIKDLSRAKLTLFLEDDELQDIKSKKIYINDKPTNYKIDKIWSVADDKFISSYRAEIVIPKPKYNFSKLLKVELR